MNELDIRDSKRVLLVDIFGPTIQGEGQLIGLPTWFVRLGGCDYKCFFCDTDYAVDPRIMKSREVRKLTAYDIAEEFLAMAEDSNVRLVTLSGGNPAMWDMWPFIQRVHSSKFKIAVETQGSIFHDWIASCDYVTISPKGPGMTTEDSLKDVSLFLKDLDESLTNDLSGVCLKIPILKEADLHFAVQIKLLADNYNIPLYLQVGNSNIRPSWYENPSRPSDDIDTLCTLRDNLLQRLDTTAAEVMQNFPELASCPILPQMHVLLWGNAERK